MRGGWVYILTNKPNGILYIGVTRDIARRTWEHREGRAPGFTRRYGVSVLCGASNTTRLLAPFSARRP